MLLMSLLQLMFCVVHAFVVVVFVVEADTVPGVLATVALSWVRFDHVLVDVVFHFRVNVGVK